MSNKAATGVPTQQRARRICVVLVDRANYGRMWPVMKELAAHPGVQLQVVCAGTMLLERFGAAISVVQADGFEVDASVYLEVEGAVPATMAKSLGLGIIEFTHTFQALKPDIVLLIGDRYEALAAAISAAYMNIALAHVQGGEVSGSIDESARHAISKFAQFHFPSTARSASYLTRMGEDPRHVHNVGCPSGDYILALESDLAPDYFDQHGVGAPIDAGAPFLLVIFHPVTTEPDAQLGEIEELLAALDRLRMPTVWLWPNADAGSDVISKTLRRYRETHGDHWARFVKNLDPSSFQKCLKMCACAVGNSSSFIRDSTFSGTPVVLVGARQTGRESGPNLVAVAAERESIFSAVTGQLAHGRYAPSTLYGDGHTSTRIVATLVESELYSQKHLHYIHDLPGREDTWEAA